VKLNEFKKPNTSQKQINELDLSSFIGDYGAAGVRSGLSSLAGRASGEMDVATRMAYDKYVKDFVGKTAGEINREVQSGAIQLSGAAAQPKQGLLSKAATGLSKMAGQVAGGIKNIASAAKQGYQQTTAAGQSQQQPQQPQSAQTAPATPQPQAAQSQQQKLDPKKAAELKGRLKGGAAATSAPSGFKNYVGGSGKRMTGVDQSGAPTFKKIQREDHYDRLNAIFESILEAKAGSNAFGQMAGQLSGANKSASSAGGTTTQTPTGRVHTAGTARAAQQAPAQASMQQSQTANQGATSQPQQPQAAGGQGLTVSGFIMNKVTQYLQGLDVSKYMPQIEKLAKDAEAAYGKGGFGGDRAIKAPLSKLGGLLYSIEGTEKEYKGYGSPGSQPSTGATSSQSRMFGQTGSQTGSATSSSSKKSTEAMAEVEKLIPLLNKTQKQKLMTKLGAVASTPAPAPASPAPPAAPSAPAPAKKPRTGGRQKGQELSQTPDAIRKRNARAAKKSQSTTKV